MFRGFESWYVQNIFLLQNVQTGSGAHPASYAMGFAVRAVDKENFTFFIKEAWHLGDRISRKPGTVQTYSNINLRRPSLKRFTSKTLK